MKSVPSYPKTASIEIVDGGESLRFPYGGKFRLQAERRDRRKCHCHRATRAFVDLMTKNHQGGSRNVSSWPPFYPRQGMGLRFNPDAHQFMVCRMVCYLVDTKTESIVGSQLRCKPIGQHAQIDRFRFA